MVGIVGMGRALVVGSVIGFVLTMAVTSGITLLAGGGWGPAIVVGAFAGFWGGPGFGGMLAAVLCSDRTPAEQT